MQTSQTMQKQFGERQIYKEVLENDFYFYVKQAVKILEPETEFKWSWHIEEICRYCEKLLLESETRAPNQELQNLDINIPPRMMKSIIVTILFPTWVWTKRPWYKFLCASRSYSLATSFNIKRREVIESDFYQSMWPIVLKEDVNTTEKFANTLNGFMQSISAMGRVTGEGADILLSDDLLDAMDAFSKTKRESVNNWFSSAFYNRVQNKKTAIRININQRLHQKDVSGHIRENHSYKRLIMPQQMTEKNLSDCGFIDPRKPGEFLFPDRYGQKEKDDEYKSLGVYGYSSQHQQSPVPEGGGIIKSEWVRRYSTRPEGFERQIITVDLAFEGKTSSDWVSFQCWGKVGGDKYLLDMIRGQWSYKKTKDMFVSFCERNPEAFQKFIENKANGPALLSDLKDKVSGLLAWPREGSKYAKAGKVQRLYLVSEEFEMGNVWLPTEEILRDVEDFLAELLGFTENGSTTGNDDMVDTCTMALLELKPSSTFFAG